MVNEQVLEELWISMLDDCHPMVKIGTLEYLPSRVLKEVDPIAYRCGMNDYESSLREDYESGFDDCDFMKELFADEEEE